MEIASPLKLYIHLCVWEREMRERQRETKFTAISKTVFTAFSLKNILKWRLPLQVARGRWRSWGLEAKVYLQEDEKLWNGSGWGEERVNLQPSAATSTKPGAGVEGGRRREGRVPGEEINFWNFLQVPPTKRLFFAVTHSRRNASCHGNLFFRVSACWLGGDTRNS